MAGVAIVNECCEMDDDNRSVLGRKCSAEDNYCVASKCVRVAFTFSVGSLRAWHIAHF